MDRIQAIEELQKAYSLVDKVRNHYEENDANYLMHIMEAQSYITESIYDLQLLDMNKCTDCACLISEHKETGHNLPGILSRARCGCKRRFNVL